VSHSESHLSFSPDDINIGHQYLGFAVVEPKMTVIPAIAWKRQLPKNIKRILALFLNENAAR